MNEPARPQKRFYAECLHPGRGSGVEVTFGRFGCAVTGGALGIGFAGAYWLFGLAAGLLAAAGVLVGLFGLTFVIGSLRLRRLREFERNFPAVLQHPVLGDLHWDGLTLAWTGRINTAAGPVAVNLFAGSRLECPDERLLQALTVPTRDVCGASEGALAFLVVEARAAGKDVKAEEFTLKEIDICEDSAGEYFLLFERSVSPEACLNRKRRLAAINAGRQDVTHQLSPKLRRTQSGCPKARGLKNWLW